MFTCLCVDCYVFVVQKDNLDFVARAPCDEGLVVVYDVSSAFVRAGGGQLFLHFSCRNARQGDAHCRRTNSIMQQDLPPSRAPREPIPWAAEPAFICAWPPRGGGLQFLHPGRNQDLAMVTQQGLFRARAHATRRPVRPHPADEFQGIPVQFTRAQDNPREWSFAGCPAAWHKERAVALLQHRRQAGPRAGQRAADVRAAQRVREAARRERPDQREEAIVGGGVRIQVDSRSARDRGRQVDVEERLLV